MSRDRFERHPLRSAFFCECPRCLGLDCPICAAPPYRDAKHDIAFAFPHFQLKAMLGSFEGCVRCGDVWTHRDVFGDPRCETHRLR